MNIIDEEKRKLASPVPWLVFDEAVAFLLILICFTFYYTYQAFSSVKKEQGVSNTVITEAQTTTISSNNISNYLDSVVQIICRSYEGKLTGGSGVLWKFDDNYNVLTNNHVISRTNKCIMSINDVNNINIGLFDVTSSTTTIDKYKDFAILNIENSLSEKNKKISEYNYSLSSIKKCDPKLFVGSPVSLIGYPSYTKRDTSMNVAGFGNISTVYRATTNGIISGHDTSLSKPFGDLLNENYFISAKIDIGNSGGVALSKDSDGLCLLGIPTWVTVGDYENQGLVQNINNIIEQ